MSIYTRQGDRGWTKGPDGKERRKDDALIEAVGVMDELNSLMGWCVQAAGGNEQASIRDALRSLQGELLAVDALLAAAGTDKQPAGGLDESWVKKLEDRIDDAWGCLGELTSFIIPGGCELACRLHVARTACRRAERRLSAASGEAISPIVIKYVNRLSDLLFALARLANNRAGVPEEVWHRGDPE